jgi:hypothetical protein
LKKFGILLIITFLRNTPELAAIILLLFLCFTMIVSALCEPFVSSLINRAHIACEFLIISVLFAGLLLTSTTTTAGPKWPEEVETLSVVIVSFAACLLAGLSAILWLETGSFILKGGRRQALWDRFVQTSHDGRNSAVATVRKLSILAGFSGVIVPETSPAHAVDDRATTVEIHSAIATGAAREDSTTLQKLPLQLTNLKDCRITALNRMHFGVLSIATNSILADVDDGNEMKVQLEQCARQLDALGDNVQLTNMKDGLYAYSLIKIRVKVLSLAARMLANVEGVETLKMQLAKCARKLEMLAVDDGLSEDTLLPCPAPP